MVDISKLPEEKRERVIELLEQRNTLKMQDDLSLFFKESWKMLKPGDELIWSWHYELISEWLTLATSGKFKELFPEKKGIIICVPPRTAKSALVTIAWPVWSWIKNPALRFFCASYSGNLAVEHSVARRDLIQSDWFQKRWSDKFALRGDRNRQELFGNNKRGDMLAVGTGGSLTGRGGHIGIIDDPLSGTEGSSEAARNEANLWVHDTFMRRFDNPSSGVTVVVAQRLHDDDVVGRLLAESPDSWVTINIPLECEEDTTYTYPVSGAYNRKKGDILQPQRFTLEYVADLKKQSRVFATQYQQRPAPKGGLIFNPNWWKYYTELPILSQLVLSVDAAFKDQEQNDYVSLQVWGFVQDRAYLIDKQTEHLGYTGTKAAIKAMKQRYPRIHTCLIEDKANGPAIIEELRRERTGMNIIAINPEGGKEARAEAASPSVEAGNVFLPEKAEWVGQFVILMSKFPNVKNDDDVDSATQALIWRMKNSLGLLDYYKKQAKEAPMNKEREEARSASEAMPTVCPKCGDGLYMTNSEWRCNSCQIGGVAPDRKANYTLLL